MIHGKSDHPALLKKIKLKLWTLRDELESVIRAELEANPDSTVVDLTKIRGEFLGTHYPDLPITPTLSVVPAAELDNSEDEMAKALAEVNAAPQTEPAATEDDMMKAIMESKTEEAPATEDDMMKAIMESKTEEAPASEDDMMKAILESQAIKPVTASPLALTPQKKESGILIKQRNPVISVDKLINGVSILAEINIDRMYFFSDKKITEGQTIIIDFQIPKRFKITAEVIFCRNYTMRSRIIREQPLTYRVAVKFLFGKQGERTLLREFLKSIEPDLQGAKKEAPAGASAATQAPPSSGGELEELDSLDF